MTSPLIQHVFAEHILPLPTPSSASTSPEENEDDDDEEGEGEDGEDRINDDEEAADEDKADHDDEDDQGGDDDGGEVAEGGHNLRRRNGATTGRTAAEKGKGKAAAGKSKTKTRAGKGGAAKGARGAKAGPKSGAADIDEKAWTDRVLNVMKFLDEKSMKALLGLSGLGVTCVVFLFPLRAGSHFRIAFCAPAGEYCIHLRSSSLAFVYILTFVFIDARRRISILLTNVYSSMQVPCRCVVWRHNPDIFSFGYYRGGS